MSLLMPHVILALQVIPFYRSNHEPRWSCLIAIIVSVALLVTVTDMSTSHFLPVKSLCSLFKMHFLGSIATLAIDGYCKTNHS